ncbi:unnamed protein product [Paramecium pentaurelia]|uniref:NACHT domain-containing protein n=1 Tax=Paramecium pentaurelia TaxID=43138 RepID=A0A8S1XMM3_9CILI|nr:unnamed protein product [Paramecium pentaurelia]
MLQLIEKTEKQVSELEISLLKKDTIIQYFNSLLNNLNIYYVHQIQELQKYFNEQLLSFKTILMLQYEIEFVSLPKKLKEIKQQYLQKLSFQCIHNQRLNILKFKLQLIAFKQFFQNIITIPSEEFLKLQVFINLDGFLIDVVKNYSNRIICCDSSFQEQTIAELNNLQITKQDYQNNLTTQKGILDYLLCKIFLEEQMIDLERIDLELIEKEFGELLIEETDPLTLTERIMKIIKDFPIEFSLNIINNENLNQNQLNIEREKYEALLQQLGKIKQQENCEVVEQLQLLICQIEKVVKLLKGSVNQNLEIFQKPITKIVSDLKEIFDKFKTKYDDKNDRHDKNTRELNSFQNTIGANLSLIVNILLLLLIKKRLEKQKLAKFLEDIKNFTKSRDVTQEHYQEMYTNFTNFFEKLIKLIKQQHLTTSNLEQQEKESINEYFSRIQINTLQSEKQSDNNNNQSTNIADFLYKLMAQTKEKLKMSKWKFQEINFNQDQLVKLTKKIYLQENDEEYEAKSYQQDQFSIDQQKYDEWKIKQISQNSFTETITRFCQKTLIQLWVLEKDQRVRNLLKNQRLISLQLKDVKMLKRIDELQDQITQEANLNKRELQLKEMDETTQQLDEYIQNISEMGQQLRLVIDFVNHIRNGLLRVEGKINQIKEQLNNMGNDLKFLRGKSVIQLLEIRKWKVLKEAAEKNVKSIYVPLKTQEKGKNEISNLMNLDQFDDKDGEVNQFLYEGKIVLLIHGLAGSGKSTTAKKIEDNKKIGNYVLIPVYISLPSLKNPVFQAVEESLQQDDYGFDDLQLKECKEMLQKKEFRFIFIMDSYDEMKLENIQKNLYFNNKLKQNWSDPLVIFTTRSDIFTSSNYADWFAPDDKQNFKKSSFFSLNRVKNKNIIRNLRFKALDFKRFEQSCEKVQSSFLKFDEARWKTETLLNEKQIISIIQFLKDDELIALKSNEACRSLSINLQKLQSFKKYEDMMKSVNLNKLVETPYMMEIIVQVLPNMILKATEIINIKQTFLKYFSKMLKEFFIKSEAEIQVDYDESLEVTHKDLQNLETIDYDQIAFEAWNNLEENSITQQLQNSQELEGVHKQLQTIFETKLLLPNQILKKGVIQQEVIIQVVYDALKEYNLAIYDFYCEFINHHHLKQIEKQRNLGKSIDTDRFLHDLLKYSIRFAKTMSKNELTQVQYKQQGFLYQNERKEDQSLNEFFNYDDQNGAYKKDIRIKKF